MNDERIQALDPATKLAVVLCDCTAAARDLARASAPAAAVQSHSTTESFVAGSSAWMRSSFMCRILR